MKKIFLIGLMGLMTLAGSNVARAQYDETNNMFYHMLRTPQSNLLNPAFFPTNSSWYITLPGADIQFGSPVAVSDFIKYDRVNERTVINLDSMMNNLTNDNKFRLGANVNLLGFGFKVNNTFINFNTRLINHVSVGFPVDMVEALRIGNIDAAGNVRPVVEMLDGDVLNATSYLETGLGVIQRFEPINLTVGVRAKLLFGVANVQTDNTRLVFNTSPNLDTVTAHMYYEIQSATCAPYDTTQKKFIFNLGDVLGNANTGIAFDLGARYDWGPFSFSFSINDLTGGIHWKNNVMTWKPQNGQGAIVFNGVDMNGMFNGGNFSMDSLTSQLEHQLEDMTPEKKDSGDYWFSIPTKINLGASYSFGRMFRAGFLFHGQFDRGLLCKSNALSMDLGDAKNTFRWNTTLSIGMNLYDWLEVTAANSIVYDGSGMDLFNPGLGIVATPGRVFQIYLMGDYLSSFYITDSKAFNLKVGINLLFGTGGRTTIEG
jgi:hypothetical protein